MVNTIQENARILLGELNYIDQSKFTPEDVAKAIYTFINTYSGERDRLYEYDISQIQTLKKLDENVRKKKENLGNITDYYQFDLWEKRLNSVIVGLNNSKKGDIIQISRYMGSLIGFLDCNFTIYDNYYTNKIPQNTFYDEIFHSTKFISLFKELKKVADQNNIHLEEGILKLKQIHKYKNIGNYLVLFNKKLLIN